MSPQAGLYTFRMSDHIHLQITEAGVKFLRSNAPSSPWIGTELERLRGIYRRHLINGGARMHFRDGREILDCEVKTHEQRRRKHRHKKRRKAYALALFNRIMEHSKNV